jgi:hypothetical protein
MQKSQFPSLALMRLGGAECQGLGSLTIQPGRLLSLPRTAWRHSRLIAGWRHRGDMRSAERIRVKNTHRRCAEVFCFHFSCQAEEGHRYRPLLTVFVAAEAGEHVLRDVHGWRALLVERTGGESTAVDLVESSDLVSCARSRSACESFALVSFL